VVIVTNHSQTDYRALAEAAPLIFDTRNAIGATGVASPKVVRL
jgi:UDP-N-acetyl-D-mannosaminuronate dehydrogenase